MLLTRADMEDRERFLNARDTLRALLDNGIVPVINENDAVATAEIKVGDNDNLSALVAILSDSDKLLLLTDQPALFSADPRTYPDSELIHEAEGINDALLDRLLLNPARLGAIAADVRQVCCLTDPVVQVIGEQRVVAGASPGTVRRGGRDL